MHFIIRARHQLIFGIGGYISYLLFKWHSLHPTTNGKMTYAPSCAMYITHLNGLSESCVLHMTRTKVIFFFYLWLETKNTNIFRVKLYPYSRAFTLYFTKWVVELNITLDYSSYIWVNILLKLGKLITCALHRMGCV